MQTQPTCGVLASMLLALGASPIGPAAPAEPPANDASDPGSVESRVLDLLDDDAWPQALDEAQKARAAWPAEPRVGSVLAACLFRAGRLDEVGPLLETLTAVDAPPSLAAITMARLRDAEGRQEDAARWVERALEAAPDDRRVLYWAADLAGNRARAIELLERYLTRSEGDFPERIESARGAVRSMRALGQRRVWVTETRPERVDVPLMPIWNESGRILAYVVTVRLGDRQKPVRLMLDTGEHGLVLVERIARKRGFEAIAETTIFGGGGNRRHKTRRGLFSTFAMGSLRFSDALAKTSVEEFDPTGRIQGVLGIAVFGGYRVTLDLAAKRLRLERPSEPLDAEPYWWISGQMLTRAAVRDGPEGLFILDTGAVGTVVGNRVVDAVDQASFGGRAARRSFGGVVQGMRLVRGLEVLFAEFTTGRGSLVAQDFSLRSRLGGIEMSGLLGLDLLAGKRIVIDTVGQRVQVTEPHR